MTVTTSLPSCPQIARQARRQYPLCRSLEDRKALACKLGLTLPQLHTLARGWGLA